MAVYCEGFLGNMGLCGNNNISYTTVYQFYTFIIKVEHLLEGFAAIWAGGDKGARVLAGRWRDSASLDTVGSGSESPTICH